MAGHQRRQRRGRMRKKPDTGYPYVLSFSLLSYRIIGCDADEYNSKITHIAKYRGMFSSFRLLTRHKLCNLISLYKVVFAITKQFCTLRIKIDMLLTGETMIVELGARPREDRVIFISSLVSCRRG